MGDVLKLLYIVVVDEEDNNDDSSRQERLSFRYTRAVLQSTLQLMGCKPRHAFKISKRVFEVTRDEARSDPTNKRFMKQNTIKSDPNGGENAILFELYKRKTTVIISREKFLSIVCHALSLYKYMGPNQRADLVLACRIRERKESVTILLCGTSGCGKSTLSALLGHRLGITSVVSTDSIRHMMRSFADEKENPLLWASTYHAGEYLDPVLVAQSKAKKMANRLLNNGKNKSDEISSDPTVGIESEIVISKKQMAIEGYKAQSEMVIDSLDRLITSWEDKKESVIIEGVHLSLNFVMGLTKKHPSIIPFMVYISNETKHMERFAVRAKYMTLDPEKNKYIKYLKNIRTIQEYLIKRAEKHLIPKINNTNVDRSVASIHATVFSCLRKHETLYDPLTNTLPVLDEEYRNQCAANSLSSKGMFQLIQRQGSSRHLMALVNTDGTVAKAWPVARSESGMNKGEKCVGDPLYGPVNIGSAEPVNLQFGGFGISAWPRDTGGASHVGNNDEGVATGCGSSRSSSPAKELVEEVSMSSSDEEQDLRDGESDEDLSDTAKNDATDDMEGSVDENSTKTDEEYEDLEYLTDEENNEPVSKEKSQEKNVLESRLEDSLSRKDHGGSGEKKKIVRTRQRALSDSLRLGRARNGLTKSLSLCHRSVIKEAHETS